MGFPYYKSSSTPADETSNSTPPPSTDPSNTSRNTRPRITSRAREQQRTRRRHRERLPPRLRRTETYLLPTEFISNSYNPATRTAGLPALTPKGSQLFLVLSPNTTSNRRKGAYRVQVTTTQDKMNSFTSSIFLNLNFPLSSDFTNVTQQHEDAPMEDPGFASDNESATSEDSILSDPDWITSNRELAMELLLGSSEDEFLGSLLGSDSTSEDAEPIEESDYYNDVDMDMDETPEENSEEQTSGSDSGARYVLREVDEDYD